MKRRRTFAALVAAAVAIGGAIAAHEPITAALAALRGAVSVNDAAKRDALDSAPTAAPDLARRLAGSPSPTP